MSRIEWNRPQDQVVEGGIDRGVLYVDDGPIVPWNGLTSVSNNGESKTKELYLDGIKYHSHVSAKNWSGSLSALTYPDAFSELVGISEVADGFYIDSQATNRFNLSYRTTIGAPNVSDKVHHKIHLLYNLVADIGDYSYETLTSSSTSPTEFSFDLLATPVRLPGYRPSAHFIIDTRKIDANQLQLLEGLLYGSSTQEPSFPSPSVLFDLMTYSDQVVVVNNGDGTWTATGSNSNIQMTDSKHFAISNVAAVYLSADIYEFTGVDGSTATTGGVIMDTDGVPFVIPTGAVTNVGVDTDVVPFVELGENDARILTDTDGAPYFEEN